MTEGTSGAAMAEGAAQISTETQQHPAWHHVSMTLPYLALWMCKELSIMYKTHFIMRLSIEDTVHMC